MALNFPSNPGIGTVYTDATSGFSYEWDGTVWKSYTPSSTSNISVLDDISSSFDGVTQTFPLTISGVSLTPVSAQQLRIVLGGVIQSPGIDYNVSATNIVFTTAPEASLEFSGVSLGPSIPISFIIDGTVTPEKLSSGGPSWNENGDVYISGIGTIQELNVNGSADLTHLNVNGSADLTHLNVTGVSTIGIGTIQELNVNGSADLTHLNVTGVSTIGIVTGATYYGDGSNLTGISYVPIAGIATYSETSGISTSLLGGNAGINTTAAPTNLYVSGSSANNIVGLGTTDANTTLDFSSANDFSFTLTGSIVLANPTGVTTGQSGVIYIQQDGSGSHTVGFGSHWDFPSATAPTLSTGANALDVITYSVRNSTSIVAAALIGIGTI